VFCQLEILRHAVQPDVRAILAKLPKTLDETYERTLKDINENNREHARRLLHCLAVAVRPLRVEELAEIIAFDFDAVPDGIPKFHAERRPKNTEDAVLSICSSLITIVDNRGSRVVQFSHFTVKEFLTSSHLASSTGQLTRYHILPGPAHTILTQICLGLLLHSDDSDDNMSVKYSPLAEYAARHWIAHAQFEDVAFHVEDGMRFLFDQDRPHFAAWIRLHDIDAESGGMLPSDMPSPLYYSALCGFHDLVRHIAIERPQLVNAFGGSFGFPLVAALCRNKFLVAELLLEHGGRVDVRDTRKQTALYKTIDRHGKAAIDAVLFLLEHGADVNARREDLWTPLHLAVFIGEFSAARMLLEHQADVNSRNDADQAPLHLLSARETSQEDDGSNIATLLVERGANVNAKDKNNATPLHWASYYQRLKIVRTLLDHGASTDAKSVQGEIPLQLAFLRGNDDAEENGVGVALLLLEHGAQFHARHKYQISASNFLGCLWKEKIGRVLDTSGGGG
jgi:ankyrin repeat protein